jgi:glucose-1-phosphate thymidylyltransferase
VPGQVTEWLDCGNKDATVYTNQRYLEYLKERGEKLVADSAKITNSVLIEPVYIGENAVITNSVVGPHVSLSANATVEDSRLSNSIVQASAVVRHANVTNSMVGNFATLTGVPSDLSLGDYNALRV